MAYRTIPLTEEELTERFNEEVVTVLKDYFSKNPMKTVFKIRTKKQGTFVFRKDGSKYHVNVK